MPENIVIIGSGPAGWTAAIYAARANLNPLVYEGTPSTEMVPGGQLMFTTEVENFPGFSAGVDGQEMMATLKKQAVRFDSRVVTADIAKVDFSSRPFSLTSDKGDTVQAEAVIVATGARANWLGLENEQRLARSGGGVSACAVCDGGLPAFRNRHLAVVGGGDTAVEEACYLTKFASKVTMIHRRDALRASRIMQQRAFDNPKLEVRWNAVVVDVLGADYVEGVMLEDTVTGERSEMECAGLFMAIGHTPNTGFLGGQLELDGRGYVIPTQPGRSYTSVEGVFAAGDVMDSVYRQAITAAGSGCMASIDAERWLAEQGVE